VNSRDGEGGSSIEIVLWDRRILRLTGSHLTLFRPDGTIECSYPRNQIIECNSSPTTWDVFLRFWNYEEIALLASSGKDTQQILRWAAGAPRLQRRSAAQRAGRKARARSRIISGGASFGIGLGLLLFTYQVGKTTGYFLVPIGAIGFGGVRLFTGLIQYVTS
jgi:hypothetical protein